MLIVLSAPSVNDVYYRDVHQQIIDSSCIRKHDYWE